MANVKVAVRVRPLCKREEDAKAVIVVNEYQENVLGVANPKIEGAEGSSDHRDRIKHFSFDYCYFSLDKSAPNYSSQQSIFNDLGSEVLDSSFDGYNVCLFAYGQTGSGKTYTMMGDEAEQGVIPRLCESLLERVSSYEEDVTFKVEVSFLEIYNERVRDLLAPPNQAKYSLKVREHPKDGPYVQDLSHHLVSDYEQVLSLMHDGNLQRTTAATHMHELSSRSHAIFTITFIQAKMSHGMPSEIVSKINLVDLAGSERASINSSKDRLQEGANINKSLVTLGNCIQALGPQMDLSKSLPETWLTARQKRAADSALTAASMESLSMSEDWDALSGPRRRTNYVPYRNSILTWLLKDSLGGNSKTIMIATISPASIHYNETMSTLRYARRAKHIVNQPIVNEDRNVRLIRELRAEIDRLRMLLNSASLASSQASLIQDQNICRMLQENEQRVDQLTEAWVEKWSNAARIMQECNVGIRKESIGVIVESELPHLIGMDDDLLSTGIILYHLKEGRTKIGRENSDNHQDIVLYGPEVADEHAVIINLDGHVVLTPLRNSKCAVNGLNVHRPVELTQGAVILLGSTNMFRFNHPAEAVKLRERRASKIPGRGLRRKSVTLHVPNTGEALSAEFGKRISLSMSLDGSWSAEPESNLKKTPMRSSFSDLSSDISPIMMFNPGLELERRHKLEAEKLENTRKQLAELEAKRAEAEAAQQEQETMMLRSLQDHQERIREQKELIERLKKEHQEAMAIAQEELAMMKGKVNNQKELGKQKLEGELTQLKEVPIYHSDLCTIPSVVNSVSTDLKDLSGLDVAKKRVALMELLQKQSQRKALAALERRQATLEVQERTAQLILKHEEQKLQDFETDPRLLEGEFSSEHSPEKELGERDNENTVDSSTENVSAELPTSGRVSPIGNSDPETLHNNNLHSPKKETKRIQKQDNKDKLMDQKNDQSNAAKKSSRKSDARPTRKVDLGPLKTKSREAQIKKESNGQSPSSSRSLSPSITSTSSSPSKSSRSSSPSKSSRSSSPSKSSRSSSPSKSSRSSSPTKSLRSDSPTKSSRSDSPTKSSRSSSPAGSTSRKSRQNSGSVFSRLYPQQDTKFDYLRKKSPPRYAEHDPHRDRDRDSPHLIRRELSPLEHDPIKLKDRRRENVQDHKHVRTSSVPSSNLPDRTKQNLHSRSRSASPCVNKPIKPVTRPKKSPVSQSALETEKAGSRAKAKSKDTSSAPHVRSQNDPAREREKNKCQTKPKRAQQTTPNESNRSSPTKRKTSKPENTSNTKTPKGLTASPSRSRSVIGKAADRNLSPKKKSEQTPSHRKTVKRPLSRSRSGKDGESTNSSSPRRKFARSPVVKPKNWPSIENLPKSTPKSEAFYVPLTSEQLRLELQKRASEQDSGPRLEGGDLETSGCEQHWSPNRKRSVGKRPEQMQTDPTLDRMGEEVFDFTMDEVTNYNNEEDDCRSSESFVDSLEEDLRHDRRTDVELEHDDGPRVVDMTSADEDEFWAIPVSSEDILTASSDEGEDDDDEDDIALNLDVHDRKQSSDTLESVNSNDELEADDPFHTTMVRVEIPEAVLVEGRGSPEIDAGNRLLGNVEIRLSHDSLDSEQFPLSPVLSDNEEARQCEDDICNVEHTDNKPIPLDMQTPQEMSVGANNVEKAEHGENKDLPREAQAGVCKTYEDDEVPKTNLIETDEARPKNDIQDRANDSPQGTHIETQSMADLLLEDDMSLEHPNLNVTFDLETVGLTEEEAEPCEKDRDDEVSERDHMEAEIESPQIVNNITIDTLPQGPCFNEVHSKSDLPDADLSSEPSHPDSTADMEIKKPPTEFEVCEVPERSELKTTDEVPQHYTDDITDHELPLEELHSDGILPVTDLPEERVVSEPLNLDVTSDNEIFRPTDANVEACEKPEENGIPEIMLVKSEQSPEIDVNDTKENTPQEQQIGGTHSETDLSDKDRMKSFEISDVTFDDEFDRAREETEAGEEDENDKNPEEDVLKIKTEDLEIDTDYSTYDLPQESDVNENQSRADLLEKDPISPDPLHPDITDEKETYGPTAEMEPCQNDENNDNPERLNIAEEEFGDASDALPQELLSNGAPSITDLPPELPISSDPLHSDVSCEEEKEGPINEAEMGKEGEPGKVPEMNQDRSTERNSISEEPLINEIQSTTDIDVDSTSPVSLQPGVTCDKEIGLPTEEEIEFCEDDEYDDVPGRSELKTAGEDPHIDIKDASGHLSQEQPHNEEIQSMPDLPVNTNTSEPSHPDVIYGKQTDGPPGDAHDISITGKPDNDRKNNEEIPNSEVVIDQHPKLQDLGTVHESHSGTPSPVEFVSRDLEPSSVCDNEIGTSINAEQEEPDKEVTNPINPIDYTEDNDQDEIETELNSNAHGDIFSQPQIKGAWTEEYLRDNAVPIEKEPANCEVTLPMPPCHVEDNKGTCDVADQVPNDLDGLDVNKCTSVNDDEDVSPNDESDDLEAAAKEDDGEDQLRDTIPVLIVNEIPNKSKGLQCPQDDGSILVGEQVQGEVKDIEQVQDEVKDNEQLPAVTIPLISIQSDADEIPTVSCTVMSNQLNQLQRPVMINLCTIQQDSSDSDEISSDLVSDDQSDFGEEEAEEESLPDEEHHPSGELFPPEERNAGCGPDLAENREQQIPVRHGSDKKDMVPDQESVSTDVDPDDDKLKELRNKELPSDFTSIPQMNSLPDLSVSQQILLGANKLLGSDDDVQVVELADETPVDSQLKKGSIPIMPDEEIEAEKHPFDRNDEKAMTQHLLQEINYPTIQSMADRKVHIVDSGPSDTKSDKSSSQHQLPMPHGNGECKVYTNNHNFRVTRASPVPFSDEEMESMESPSSCSSTSAAEYRFDEEQTLSDFLEDRNEVDDEEAAMSDDVSAFQNSEVNGEITDISQDNRTDNTSGESETGLGVPKAVRKGTLPYIQASLPPSVYKTIFNAESPLKQNILTNSVTDSTLPDESILYQSAIDTSLYQTAVESPSAFTNKNNIIPFKNTWKKDEILAYSTPTGTPEGTPVAKGSENLDQNEYCPTMKDQNGDSPVENKCRVPPQLSASPSSTMARKIPFSSEVTAEPHGTAGTGGASSMNENIPAVDYSICIGDISTDTKSGPNFYPEINDGKEENENGEELRGLYHSPRDLPEQSYILHTLETIEEEDSKAEDSESEDTCSTLHSNSPQNTRETSPIHEDMSVASPEDVHHGIPQNTSPTSLDNEEITTKLPVQEIFSTAQPDEMTPCADQEVDDVVEPNDAVGSGRDSDASADQSLTQNTNECLDNDYSDSTAIKPLLKEDEMLLPENSMSIKQETSSSNVDSACEQVDDVPEAKGLESEAYHPNTSLFNKRTPDNSEDVISKGIPTACDETNVNLPENSIRSKESPADDVKNTERKGDSVPDLNEQDGSMELIETNPNSKGNDVFSRLYPKNAPKFEFKRKSAASAIPKGRSFGNVSPKIKRKDLKARKSGMSAAETSDDNKNCDIEHPASEDDVVGESPPVSSVLTYGFDKTSDTGNQKDDLLGTFEVCNSDPAVNAGEDSVPETNLESEPEEQACLNDRIAEDLGATNEMEPHEGDEDTTNKIATPSPNKYSDAYESEAVEKLKPFLGKDYAIASAKLTMFMRMFGLSVESTDSSEGSDSLRMHTDKGLVNRIVGEGVGYDPDTFKYNVALANSLSLSPGSTGNKEDETVLDGVEYDGDQSWMGSDVAVDGDSSIRELRSRSTTASDAELMSGGDDAMTDSTSAMSLRNIDEDQKLETPLKHPTNLTRMLPEPCITKSMQLAYPGVDIAHTLNKLDIEAPKSTELNMKEDPNIKELSGSSSVGMGKQDTLDPDVDELSEVDFDGETGPMEACKNRDHNHNMDSPQVLKSDDDDDDAPATPYREDESMLPSPSSVANQQVPIQIQESVITSREVPEVKHPDMSLVEKVHCDDAGQSKPTDKHEPYEDEGHDYKVLSSESKIPDTVPRLTPTIPEVIHASKVQLEDNMVSSIKKLKDVFAQCHDTPSEDNIGVDRENDPSSEVNTCTKEGERELPFEYVGGNESPINNTCESDNSTPLQKHVSERITVDKVQLAEMSLSALLKKACIGDGAEESPKITLKEKNDSEPQHEQQKDQLPVHIQNEAVQLICKEDKVLAEHHLPQYHVGETCTKSPAHLPEHTLPVILSKLDESKGPFSQQMPLGESQREDAFKPEQTCRMKTDLHPYAPEVQEQQRTLGKDHSQSEPIEPVDGTSTRGNGDTDCDQNRSERAIHKGDKASDAHDLPNVHVSETFTKNPIHLPEHSLPAMLSKLAESEGPLSQQSSGGESKREDASRQELNDKKYIALQRSAAEEVIQQRTPSAAVLENTVINRNSNDADDLKQVQPLEINLKKDQGINTDDALGVHVNDKGPAVKDVTPIPCVFQSGVDIDSLATEEPSHEATAKKVSHASCGTSDDLGQTDSDICKHDLNAKQQVPFKVTALAEPIQVNIAYPSSDEPIKWHLLSTDASKGSTQSFKDGAVMVTPAIDKSTQYQATDVVEDQANGDLDSSVLPGREYMHRSTSLREIASNMHSFKPITPSPRHIIAASHMEPTKVEEMNVDAVKNALDSYCITREHITPSPKPSHSAELPSETELTLSKASLHKETQSDPPEATQSLQVPPIQAVNGVSPVYSPLLSSRSTDDELAQILASLKQRTPMKHTFTNTSPEVTATQRSIMDASTSTHDSLDCISNDPVQDIEAINSTACAQTSPFEIEKEPRSILDASTATDDSLDHISSVPGSDIYETTHTACAQTSPSEKPTATACVQTSPFKELDNSKDCDMSHQSTATETEALTPHHMPSTAIDPGVTDIYADENENNVLQPTLCEEYVLENRSIGTSPIVQLDLSTDAPQAEHFSPLNMKTNTPNIVSVDEQENQANLSSQSNNQECQTDLSPSGPSSPASSADGASGLWRRASEVLEELSENMDTEELELFAVLMHKRRLSEQTVDRVKGLAAKLRKSNQSDELGLLDSDMGSQDEPSQNTPNPTNAVEEVSSPQRLDDVLGSKLGIPRKSQLEDNETHPNQNITHQTLSPLPLSETGTREFEFRDIGTDDQPSRNEKENSQTVSPIDDEFLTLPGQNGSVSPPLVSALEQSHSIAESSSPRGEVTFDRKPTPPTKTQSERPTTHRPPTYSKVPVSHDMGTSSHNDWHSMPLQSTWEESLNRNNNSSTDYSEDDIGNGEIAVDILKDDPLKQDSTGSKNSPKATLSRFSDVSFDSELDFPVDQKERLDQKDEMKSQRNHASTQSLDSDLFLDGTEPELLALQADTEDLNTNTGSLQFDFRRTNGLGEKEDEGEWGDDQGEVENQLNDAESFRMHMPPISPTKLEWLLAESETEPDVRYLPLSKHPEKDKIPLPGFKHHNTEGPLVIEKQPSEELMQQLEGKVHPQHTEVEAYPVKFAMDHEQREGTVPSSSLASFSARSTHVPRDVNQTPANNNPYPGAALPSGGNRHGNLERTGSSLGESSGIYSLASEIPNQHHMKTPSGSLESLLNAASTDEERDLRRLQSEYEQLLQGRTSSSLHPVETPGSSNAQQVNRLKGSGDANENSHPRSNGVLNGYSSGDSASSSEMDGFVHGHYSQSMDRRDISIELLEAQVMHGIGETDALLKFLDDDLPVEYWKARKSQPISQPGKVGKPTTDKREITHNPSNNRNKSPVYQFRKSPSSSLNKSPSGLQSSRSSPSSVTPPPLQRVVTPLLRRSPSKQSPSPKGRFRPSEHLKFLRRVRENVVKETANPTSPTPPIPSPRPQLYTSHQVDEPLGNIRTSSSFNMERNEMELFLDELREARKMSQSEIAKAEKELHPSRRRYSAGDDSVFADATPGTHHPGGGNSRNHHPPLSVAEKDGHQSLSQRIQRSDEDIIDREIASMRAAASVIHPPSATSPPGTSPCKEEGDQSAEEMEGSPSKPYCYEMYDLPSKVEPLSRNTSQNRPQSHFGYSLYKDPPRSHAPLTKTYPPSTSSLRGDDHQRAGTPLHKSGSIQLQQYTPLKSTGSSSSLPAPPPNRRSTPQPSGVYLSVPQHRGAARPRGGDSIQNYRGSPGSQVKISPVKSSLRNRRQHAGKPFQELPTVRESKLVWSRPECHLVAETALQTLVSEMGPCTTFDPRKSRQPEEERGWRYEGRERDILLLCKTHSPTTSPINSYAGIGIIKAPARTVFNYVKNPTNRQLYDPMLKEVKMKKDFGDDLQVVYMVFKTDQCLLQHPRDCLCIIKTLEMDDRFLVVAASIKHPRIPPKKKTIRAEVLLAGCSIQPLLDGDTEHCRVTHLSQVNLNGDLQPKLINALSSSLPMCIADLRNIVQIGDV